MQSFLVLPQLALLIAEARRYVLVRLSGEGFGCGAQYRGRGTLRRE